VVNDSAGCSDVLLDADSRSALGEVHDVLLDDDGRVVGFELVSSSMGGLRHQYSTVPYASGLTVGADAVVVPDEAAPPVD
jgi:uncharacterized protein YrrD